MLRADANAVLIPKALGVSPGGASIRSRGRLVRIEGVTIAELESRPRSAAR